MQLNQYVLKLLSVKSSNFGSLATPISEISNALNSFPADAGTKLNGLSKGLSSLANNMDSIKSIRARDLNSAASALSKFAGAAGQGLSAFNALGKTKTSVNTFNTGITNLATGLNTLATKTNANKGTFASLSESISRFSSSITTLGNSKSTFETASNGLNDIASAAERLNAALQEINKNGISETLKGISVDIAKAGTSFTQLKNNVISPKDASSATGLQNANNHTKYEDSVQQQLAFKDERLTAIKEIEEIKAKSKEQANNARITRAKIENKAKIAVQNVRKSIQEIKTTDNAMSRSLQETLADKRLKVAELITSSREAIASIASYDKQDAMKLKERIADEQNTIKRLSLETKQNIADQNLEYKNRSLVQRDKASGASLELRQQKFEYQKQRNTQRDIEKAENKQAREQARISQMRKKFAVGVVGAGLTQFGGTLQQNSETYVGKAAGGAMSLGGSMVMGAATGAMLGGPIGAAIGALGVAVGKATEGLAGFYKASIDAAASMEKLKTQLSVVYGNDTQASSTFKELQEYAVKSPFGVEQVTEMAVLLKQSGVYSSDILETMRMIGDVAGGNNEKMERIANNYAQIQAAGRATSLDMRQFAMAGIPIYQELTRMTGKSLQTLRQMTQEGKLSAEMIEQAFKNLTGKGGSFEGAVSRGAQTYAGRKQNLEDTKMLAKAGWGQTFQNMGSTYGNDGWIAQRLDTAERFWQEMADKRELINIERSVQQIEKASSEKKRLEDLLATAKSEGWSKEEIKEIQRKIDDIDSRRTDGEKFATYASAYDLRSEKQLKFNTSLSRMRDINAKANEIDPHFGMRTFRNKSNVLGVLGSLVQRSDQAKGGVNPFSQDADENNKTIERFDTLISTVNEILKEMPPDKGVAITSLMIYAHNMAEVNKNLTGYLESHDKEMNGEDGTQSIVDEWTRRYMQTAEYKQKKEEFNKNWRQKRDDAIKASDKVDEKGLIKEGTSLSDIAGLFKEFGAGGHGDALEYETLFNKSGYLKADAQEMLANMVKQGDVFRNALQGTEGMKDANAQYRNTRGYNMTDTQKAYRSFDAYTKSIEQMLKGGITTKNHDALMHNVTQAMSAAIRTGNNDIITAFKAWMSGQGIDLSAKSMHELVEEGRGKADKAVPPLWKRVEGEAFGLDPEKITDSQQAVAEWQIKSEREMLGNFMQASLADTHGNMNLNDLNGLQNVLENVLTGNVKKMVIGGENIMQSAGAIDSNKNPALSTEKTLFAILNNKDNFGKMSGASQAMLASVKKQRDDINKFFGLAYSKGEDAQNAETLEQQNRTAFSMAATKDGGIAATYKQGNETKDAILKRNENGEWEAFEKDAEGNLVKLDKTLKDFTVSYEGIVTSLKGADEKIASAVALTATASARESSLAKMRNVRFNSGLQNVGDGVFRSSVWRSLNGPNSGNWQQSQRAVNIADNASQHYNEALQEQIKAMAENVKKGDKLGGASYLPIMQTIADKLEKGLDIQAETRELINDADFKDTNSALKNNARKTAIAQQNAADFAKGYNSGNKAIQGKTAFTSFATGWMGHEPGEYKSNAELYGLMSSANDHYKAEKSTDASPELNVMENIYKDFGTKLDDIVTNTGKNREGGKEKEGTEGSGTAGGTTGGATTDTGALTPLSNNIGGSASTEIAKETAERTNTDAIFEARISALENKLALPTGLPTETPNIEMPSLGSVLFPVKPVLSNESGLPTFETPQSQISMFNPNVPNAAMPTVTPTGNDTKDIAVTSWENMMVRKGHLSRNDDGTINDSQVNALKDLAGDNAFMDEARAASKLKGRKKKEAYAMLDEKYELDKIGLGKGKKGSVAENALSGIEKTGRMADSVLKTSAAIQTLGGQIQSLTESTGLQMFTDSFEHLGNCIMGSAKSAGEFGKQMKAMVQSSMKSLSPMLVQAGLQLIIADPVQNKMAGIMLIAAGGMAGIVSGLLGGGSDKSDDKDNEEEDKINRLKDVKDQMADLLAQAREDALYYEKELTHKKALSTNTAVSGSNKSVNDAIIAPNGDIITTAPDDYLIATKTPQDYGAGGMAGG